ACSAPEPPRELQSSTGPTSGGSSPGRRTGSSCAAGGRSRARLPGEPLAQLGVPRGPGAVLELRAQLGDGAVPLGDDVVRVDRLEVELAREQEVAVVELRV